MTALLLRLVNLTVSRLVLLVREPGSTKLKALLVRNWPLPRRRQPLSRSTPRSPPRRPLRSPPRRPLRSHPRRPPRRPLPRRPLPRNPLPLRSPNQDLVMTGALPLPVLLPTLLDISSLPVTSTLLSLLLTAGVVTLPRETASPPLNSTTGMPVSTALVAMSVTISMTVEPIVLVPATK